jgi:DnaJ homolog subfamily C member 17
MQVRSFIMIISTLLKFLSFFILARKFHELNQAYELLLDPLRRLALDAKMRVKHARAERFKSYDNKRKNLVNELEEREQAFKKARMEKQKEEVETWQQTEKIKDEGRRLREEKEKELRNRMKQEEESMRDLNAEEEAPPSLGLHFLFLFLRCLTHP